MDKKPQQPVKNSTVSTKPSRFSPLRNGLKEPKRAAIALLLIVCLSLGFLGGFLGARSQNHQAATSLNNSTSKQIVTTQSQLINQIAKDVGPSVVSVDVTTQSAQTNFFGFSSPTEQQAAGTGIIISSDGVILTNRHVVPAGTTTVSVTLSDGTTLDNVSVIGRTADTDSLDVAFLKVNDKKGKTLQPATLGDSSKMQVGDMVVAIGNALGQFQNTVTSGIISGYGRSVEAGDQSGGTQETLQNLFQTDAAINEGNSGGPLVNSDGQVIGINTAVAGDAQNIGFAIPINDVKGLITSVLDKGKLERPYLGVRYISLTDDIAYQYNLSTKRGAYIAPGANGQSSIISGSPADKAGLQEKDIITKINDTTIDENHSLTSILGQYQVGDKVTLTVIRDGKTITVPVTLEAAPTQ